MNGLTQTYTLNDGHTIPIVGFGTWQSPDGDVAEEAVLNALEAGYRHIDTAAIYGNEESVGRAIKKSGIPREELFVTTKLWNTHHSYDKAKEALDESLAKLQLDYVNLYLIHWPNPLPYRDRWSQANAEVWKAMEEAVELGKTRSIGVSNFHQRHLEPLLEVATIKPTVNQIFLNPSDMQPDVVSFSRENGILIEAYSPLGTGKIFDVDKLKEVASSYRKTVAQIVLRWSLQHGFLPLPKSVTKERIVENTELFDFELTESDMKMIDTLHGTAGLARNPDESTY